MKYSVAVLACFVSLTLYAQKKTIPQGFEWVKKRNLIVSTYEVSCEQWHEFLEESGIDETLLPKPNRITSKCIYTKEAGEVVLRDGREYFRDSTFTDTSNGKSKKVWAVEKCEDMPVTDVTYEQALAFCKWITEDFASNPKYSKLNLTFRLPTPQETDSLLRDVLAFPKTDDRYLAMKKGINKEGCALYNHRHESWCDTNTLMKKEFGYGVPMRSGIFFADPNGLHDLMGNVAEMTSEKGIAKGGSCNNTAAECQPGVVNRYTDTAPWLGFRIVADLKN
jgi:formylglycine-generating enzyme required for sulfatase activity